MSTYPGTKTEPRLPTQERDPAAPNHWGARRVLSLLFGCVLLLASLTIAAGAAAIAIASATHRDLGGYLMSDFIAVGSGGYAVTSTNLEIQGAARLPHRILGDAKVAATPNGDTPLFVGVAASSDVSGYLAGVQRTQVYVFAGNPVDRELTGGAPARRPTSSDIWVAQASGSGVQTVEWPVENGNWTIVVMNADGGRGVSAEVSTGATVPGIGWVYGGLFIGAGVTLVIGAAMVAGTARRTRSTA